MYTNIQKSDDIDFKIAQQMSLASSDKMSTELLFSTKAGYYWYMGGAWAGL